jgi:hypothetical protein
MLLDSSYNDFRDHFRHRLADMLAPDELGAFILVLANSMQDERLCDSLQPRIQATFEDLREAHGGGRLKAAADDLAVFEALLDIGIDAFGAWTQRAVGPWRTALNPLRALRPERASSERFESLHRPFDEGRFHFDKPFLKPEILSEERFEDRALRVMYHKFPFSLYHLLILLEPAAHHAQLLAPWSQRMAWNLAQRLSDSLPGVGLAYNSLGAGASVNHLHVHGFVDPDPLPIESALWTHNGGERAYPLRCQVARSNEDAWQMIEALHVANQPYNLLYRPGRCYVIERPAQGLVALPAWLPSTGWFELCGGFNLVQRSHFESLAAGDIESSLGALALP